MNTKIISAIKEVGIERLTDLQTESFNTIYSGKNTLIVAPTGSGKTEAAILPLFQKIIETKPKKGIVLLYITPLRALNRDMFRRLRRLSELLGITIDVRHGDTPERIRNKQSKKPPIVLITTPETFQLLFLGKNLKAALKNVKYLVIDEIHELISSERGVQLSIAIERLKKITKFQIIALSATVSSPKKFVDFLGIAAEVVSEPHSKPYRFRIVKPKLIGNSGELDEIQAEISLIKEIIEKHNSTLIFVNTRQTAEALGVRLKKMVDVEVHHGSLSREARVESEEKFAMGELKALICTSSMELGIDIGHVDVVIQYGSPRQVVRLIQRVGRSGHGLGRESVGYIVASSFDDILESMAIVSRAKEGKLEKPDIHYASLDVLANQICAMALEYGRVKVDEVYKIVKRSHPYRSLEFEEFLEICQYLAGIGRIFFDGDEIAARIRTRRYFYNNISMIPDEKKLKVVDITSNRSIGVLDESFLSTFSGETFAMRGELWRVLSVENEVVKVEPVSIEGEIPSWAGEEIPVPFEVAQDVGRLRVWIAGLISIHGEKKALEIILREFNLNLEAAKYIVNKIKKQINEGFSIPSDLHLTIEGAENVVVVNACFGHKVNETIGRIIGLLLSARRGGNVSVEIDPYRIKIAPADPKTVEEILLSVNPQSVEVLAERALLETRLMQWKVVNSARKFGLLDKDEDLSRVNLKNLVIKLRDSPVYKEALREIFLEKMDLKRTKEIFGNLGRKITYSVYNSLSPISLASRRHVIDILSIRPTSAILKAFKERIKNETCRIYCINCGANYLEKVSEFNKFKCFKCGSSMLAVLNKNRDIKEVRKEELYRIANLVMAYGKRAVYALSAYGVGVETATRILSKFYENEDEFFKALLEAERNYIRTRRFWD